MATMEYKNDIGSLGELFKNPGAEYRAKPFWSWNGELERDELLRQIDVMKEMGFGGFFMHSRSGLITEYLGDEWFELINAAADYGEKLGMEAWLYDEDRWPSGSAGGIVTRDPKYRMKSVVVHEIPRDKFKWYEGIIGAWAARLEGVNLISYEKIDETTDLSDDRYEGMCVLCFDIRVDMPESVFNGATYLDTMMQEAVEKFIEVTHGEYAKRCGDRIGTSIKGIFTDEPHRGKLLDQKRLDENGFVCCPICYTDDIFEEFEKRFGYDVREKLPELFYLYDGEHTKRVKHDYVDLACNLFTERFAGTINKWCKAHGIDFTGHALHENSPVYQTVPNGSLMRFYANMGVPGVDLLTEWENSFWVAKQVQSTARQLGQPWILSELYGCIGWQFNFKGHKAIGDWQALYGVNVRCPHLSWYTMEGEAKRDYPASILHQSAWYKYYDYIESYFARFGAVMAAGSPVCDVLVLNAIESVWLEMYSGWTNWMVSGDPKVLAHEEHYAKLFMYLQGRHIDFDYGEEFLLEKNGAAELSEGKAVIRVGNMRYKTIVISGARTIRKTTLELLERFVSLGGHVIVSGNAPEMIDAVCSGDFDELAKKYPDNVAFIDFSADALEAAVASVLSIRTTVKVQEKDSSAILCQLRMLSDSVIAAFVNTDRYNGFDDVCITFETGGGSDAFMGFDFAEEWCLTSGERFDITDKVSFEDGGRITVMTDFVPCGEHIFVFGKSGGAARDKRVTAEDTSLRSAACGVIGSGGIKSFELNEKNVLVLDYAAYRFKGGEMQPAMEVLKVDRAIRDIACIEHRSGNMLQPWYSKKYEDKEYGELELVYTFYIDEMPKGAEGVVLACERPEKISYSINGHALTADGGFWTDICFKTMPVPAEFLKRGKNEITAKTVFRRTTNIESVYIIGNFGVYVEEHEQNTTRVYEKCGKGRFFGNEKHIVAPAKELPFGNIAQYGLPFYSGEITYVIDGTLLPLPDKNSGERLVLKFDDFVGALVKVSNYARVADKKEDIIVAWDPYEADITDIFDGGDIAVTLVCTRRNTFGPLHLVPALTWSLGPEHFTTSGDSFSDDYVLMDSGIFGGVKYEIR